MGVSDYIAVCKAESVIGGAGDMVYVDEILFAPDKTSVCPALLYKRSNRFRHVYVFTVRDEQSRAVLIERDGPDEFLVPDKTRIFLTSDFDKRCLLTHPFERNVGKIADLALTKRLFNEYDIFGGIYV